MNYMKIGLDNPPYQGSSNYYTTNTYAVAKTAYATTTYFELVARNYAGYSDYSAVASAVPTAGSATEAPAAPQYPDANANKYEC